MDRISQFIHPLASVAVDAGLAEARNLFNQAPALTAVAVHDGARTIGVILRDAVLSASDAVQDIADLVQTDCRVLDADLPPLDAARLLADDCADGHDGFLLRRGEEIIGAGTLRSLLDSMRRAQDGVAAAVQTAETLHAAGDEAFKVEFLDLISQELRIPIDGLLAMTELLERQPLGADAQSQVAVIREAGETLARLLSASTDLVRAEQGLLELRPQTVLLRGVIDDVQAEWAARAARVGVALLISYEGDADLKVTTDAARLRQVFDHLVETALAYTRYGSLEVSLKADVGPDGVHLQGRVRDSGSGVSPEILARIFETHAEASAGGVAAALARQVVLAMGGRIRAESNVGAGVAMMFDLHCEQAMEAVASPEAVTTSAAHVLVVDDNATNRMVAEALVEMFDCTSETACDGVEAVEVARSGRFDVILMDIKMPRMDGMAATRAIRGLPGKAGMVPIIALTANVDPEDARAYLACGMCTVVEKPIKPDRLLQAINDALASASERRQSAAA